MTALVSRFRALVAFSVAVSPQPVVIYSRLSSRSTSFVYPGGKHEDREHKERGKWIES